MIALGMHENNVIEYALDGLIPDSKIGEVTIHHESLLLQVFTTIKNVGATIEGEYIKHSDGKTIPSEQFEIKDK